MFRETPLVPLAPASKLGLYVVPGFVRDAVYDAVANNRYGFFGQSDQCRLDGGDKYAQRFVSDP
jgi:predicted DCC family thiol-disulfide oxidoreductase YuxK